ncbi:MAG: tRNA uridine-5-carboxymethylaminomethyl(34) synthesis GTPase MnmE, partial [Clostridia bacterium]|nr:tRNA uridine-5-carboxymethylaminomethyl(34) synthesis GTPase MnmE [Clostridia bacterium]
EDTVEISCHGGEVLCREILARAYVCGAVPATAGEFTRRAFSAGKLSLTEAEAVIGMIDAKSTAALSLSRKNLDGKLTRELERIYQKLREVVGSVYAGIDFPDEDLETLDEGGMARGIDEAAEALARLNDSYRAGHAVCEGVRTVISGKPNTGKSTVLNLICGEDRAIVTAIPGTTRDVVSEKTVVGEVTLDLRDTAGIRETSDEVEKLGVARSLDEIEKCELMLAVFDTSRPLDHEDRTVISFAESAAARGAAVIYVLNKIDLETRCDMGAFDKYENVVTICAKDETSKAALSDMINALFVGGALVTGDAVVTNARQHASVARALEFVKSARTALDTLGTDIAGSELERAMSEISELDGREVGVDVVNEIFGKFCVGK